MCQSGTTQGCTALQGEPTHCPSTHAHTFSACLWFFLFLTAFIYRQVNSFI